MTSSIPKQVKYFDGEFLQAADFDAAQDFATLKLALHNSNLHRWGIASGLAADLVSTTSNVIKVANGEHRRVAQTTFALQITSGFAIDNAGNEIVYDGENPAPPALPTQAGYYYLTIQYNLASPTQKDPKRSPEIPIIAFNPVSATLDLSIYLILGQLTIPTSGDPTFQSVNRTEVGLQASGLRADTLAIRGLGTSRPVTGLVTCSSQNVSGTNTYFLKEIAAGDQVVVAGETQNVIEVLSDVSLTVEKSWVQPITDQPMQVIPSPLSIQTDLGTTGLLISSAGNLPLGGKIPKDFSLIFRGTVYSGSLATLLDSTLRHEHHHPISDPLEKLKGLKGVELPSDSTTPHPYAIAEESSHTHSTLITQNGEGNKYVHLPALMAILIETMKSYDHQLNALREEVKHLKKELEHRHPKS